MDTLNEWIDKELKEVALKLPTFVHSEPSSFSCGYNLGYKNALLDLIRFLEKENL